MVCIYPVQLQLYSTLRLYREFNRAFKSELGEMARQHWLSNVFPITLQMQHLHNILDTSPADLSLLSVCNVKPTCVLYDGALVPFSRSLGKPATTPLLSIRLMYNAVLPHMSDELVALNDSVAT